MISPGQDSSPLDEGVQQLSLNAGEGQKKTFSRDELWKTFGPQTLHDASVFVRRVAVLKTENNFTEKAPFLSQVTLNRKVRGNRQRNVVALRWNLKSKPRVIVVEVLGAQLKSAP